MTIKNPYLLFCFLSILSIALTYFLDRILGLRFFGESSVDALAGALYLFVLAENVYRAKKSHFPLYYTIITSTLIVLFFQREFNLFRRIGLVFFDLQTYRSIDTYIYLGIFLVLLCLFLFNIRYYFSGLNAKIYAFSLFVLLIATLSQIPDAFDFNSDFALSFEEGLELLIPLCIFWLMKEFRANMLKKRRNELHHCISF